MLSKHERRRKVRRSKTARKEARAAKARAAEHDLHQNFEEVGFVPAPAETYSAVLARNYTRDWAQVACLNSTDR